MKENKAYLVNKYSPCDGTYRGCRLLSVPMYKEYKEGRGREYDLKTILTINDHPKNDALVAINFMKNFADEMIKEFLKVYKGHSVLEGRIKYNIKHSSTLAVTSGVSVNMYVLSFLVGGSLDSRETNIHINNVNNFVSLANMIESACGFFNIESHLWTPQDYLQGSNMRV